MGAHPRLAPLRRVLATYEGAGGGLLAAGLAFSSLFALVPAILLVTGVLGIIVGDPERRAAIVEALVRHVPPIRDLLSAGLEGITAGAAPLSVVAFVGLVWGTSRFYSTLESALGRIFVEGPRRGVIRRTALGIASVVVLVGAVVGGLAASAVSSFLAGGDPTAPGAGLVGPAVSALVSGALSAVAVVLVYRVVPSSHPGWRAAALPGTVVGVALLVLTQAMVYLAPRLVATTVVFGSLATVFLALVWLSLGFQMLLVGAAWVRERTVTNPPGEDVGV